MKPYSPFDNIAELLDARAAGHGDRPALIFEGETVSYAQLDERTERVRGWLAAAGVGRGDAVAVLMRNSLEFVDAWLGIARSGAVCVPINTAMVGEGLAYVVDHSEAVGIFADADLLRNVDAADCGERLRWRVTREPVEGAEPFAAVLAHPPAASPAPNVAAGDAQTIIYTSGTTGMPKGVVLSHRSYLNTGAYFSHHLRLGADDVYHTCLPLFHCNAQQTSLMGGFALGIPVALEARFSVSRYWSWIAATGATVSNLLGTMLTLLAKAPEAPGDAANTLRYIPSAPVPKELHRSFERRFGLQLIDGYGLTETGTMCAINPVDDARPGTIGRPLEYNEIRIVDERDRDLPDGEPGELITRSRIPHTYMTGYFKEPEKTAEAMAGGWFHTGDRAYRRDDGYHVFLDRMRDTIRRRGENVSSFLIEKSVDEHPDVVQSAALGVPSELGEQDVKLIAVLAPGAATGPADLVEWCRGRMADFMVPRYVELRESLPTTETGRVHKYKLRDEGIGDAWDREREQPRGAGSRA